MEGHARRNGAVECLNRRNGAMKGLNWRNGAMEGLARSGRRDWRPLQGLLYKSLDFCILNRRKGQAIGERGNARMFQQKYKSIKGVSKSLTQIIDQNYLILY